VVSETSTKRVAIHFYYHFLRVSLVTHFPFRPIVLLASAGVVIIAISSLVTAQVFNKELEVRVHGLPKLVARSDDPTQVLVTSLHTILRNPQICCTQDSALGDVANAADSNSLKDLERKLAGRHVLSDGRAVSVTTEYLTPEQMNAGHLIQMVKDQHAALLQWNSHVYVVAGLVYVWIPSGTAEGISATSAVRKFLLVDTRYSDERRIVEFNRDTDDLTKIEGLLFIQAKLQ
jgi:hypothetical protein